MRLHRWLKLSSVYHRMGRLVSEKCSPLCVGRAVEQERRQPAQPAHATAALLLAPPSSKEVLLLLELPLLPENGRRVGPAAHPRPLAAPAATPAPRHGLPIRGRECVR